MYKVRVGGVGGSGLPEGSLSSMFKLLLLSACLLSRPGKIGTSFWAVGSTAAFVSMTTSTVFPCCARVCLAIVHSDKLHFCTVCHSRPCSCTHGCGLRLLRRPFGVVWGVLATFRPAHANQLGASCANNCQHLAKTAWPRRF